MWLAFAARSAPPSRDDNIYSQSTNSLANSAKRSSIPSAQRYSIRWCDPRSNQAGPIARQKAGVHLLHDAAVLVLRKPMVGSFPDDCAVAFTRHARPHKPISEIKLAPLHSITSSARASRVCGTVTPSVLPF